MKRTLIIVSTIVMTGTGVCRGQVSGNVAYAQAGGKARAEQSDLARRVLTQYELPPTGTSTFVEASVLMNVKPDEYVAVFGVVLEAENVAECGRKMDATLKEFSDGVNALGVAADDLFVDFVAQNKVYGYEVTGDIAREKLVGFELKKNVAIHFKDRPLLDKLVLAAARARIFDLIKVDSVVKDVERIQDRLADEAARVIKRKTARTERLLGIKLQPPAQVYAEKFQIHYPTELYDSYTAYESWDPLESTCRHASLSIL